MGIVCLVLLFAVGMMGIGYAGWAESIFIAQDVETGILSAGIRSRGVNDHGPDPNWLRGPNPEGLDIGYIRCADGPYVCELDGAAYSESVEVNICGYPSYAAACTVEMANCGSIPAKVETIDVDWYGDLAGNILVGDWAVNFPDGYRKTGSGLTSLKRTIRCASIDPGQKIWLDIEFRVTGKRNKRKVAVDAIREVVKTVVKAEAAEAAKAVKIITEKETGTEPVTERYADPVANGPPAGPLTKPAAGPKAETEAGIEIECGSATGTITVTYRRWNEMRW